VEQGCQVGCLLRADASAGYAAQQVEDLPLIGANMEDRKRGVRLFDGVRGEKLGSEYSAGCAVVGCEAMPSGCAGLRRRTGCVRTAG
jgi:hypothetical protein